ncbi:MAG: META domain-containing protein, partial [Burkholderiales bacterium]|nr:META domain-containing protein [Burkholderiales bacterium]
MGSFKVDGAGLTFSQMASTMMACPPEESAQERAIADVLARTRGWRATGGTLVMTDAGGATLAELAAAVALEGRWRFVDIAGQTPVDSPRGAPGIEFKGTDVRVETGCNRMSGPAKHDAERLSMPMLRSTRMACPEPLMAQESAIAKALQGTAAWRAEGTRLELVGTDGEVRATLERQS